VTNASSTPARGATARLLLPLLWRGQARSDLVWLIARLLFALNWAFNAFPGKYRARWYQQEFSQHVGYFAHGNPWPPAHAFLQDVVLAHPAFFAGMSAAGETAAALLLLLPVTTRLGGAVAAAVGLSYSIASNWINLGYVVHNGSFALLGLLFLVLGGWLPRTTSRRARWLFIVLGAVGLGLAFPMAFRWEGVLSALPWAAAALALLVHGVLDHAHGGGT
jgi:hypothetical protein